MNKPPEISASEDNETQQHESLFIDIGQRLQQARQQRQLNIHDVSHQLKLRKQYLEALEAGDWQQLPGDAYAIGFLKQYARLLQLDLKQEIEQIKSGEYRLTSPLTFPDPPIAPSRKWAFGAAAVFILLFILFNVSQVSHDSIESVPDVPVAEIPDIAPPDKEITATVENSGDNINASVDTDHTVQTVTQTNDTAAQQTEPETAPMDTAATPAATETISRQAPTPEHEFTFEAVTSDVWLEVYLPDKDGSSRGERKIYRLLKKGGKSSFTSPATAIIINAGSPLGLQVSIDGTVVLAAGSVGKKTQVLRNYKLVVPSE